jgi:alpha-galactosidase
VVIHQLTLTNPTSRTSPPVTTLDAFHLTLPVYLHHQPTACSFGGMGHLENTGFYPPPAYRFQKVSFGEVPASKSYNPRMHPLRYWGGHRHYAISSSALGHSAHPHLPFLVLHWRDDGGRQRGVWVALEWSGSWFIEVFTDARGRFTLRAGPGFNRPMLSPKESLPLPPVHVGTFEGPLETGCNQLRRYIRDTITPKVEGRAPLPIQAYDSWMGIHSRFTEALLMKQVDVAANLGLEYFVLDAGWYHSPHPGWFNNNGNWERVDARKLPRGLEPLAQYVQKKGLKFGLWFEPERASAGSDWVTQHPTWFLHADTPQGPSWNLNLALPQVQDHLIETLSGYITRLDLRWIRWDYNQPPGPFWDAADPTGKIQFAYLAGLYRVWDTLLARHPKLLLDLGWRMDLASMKRSVTTIMADYAEDPHIVRAMQTAAARIVPPTYLNGFTYCDKGSAREFSPLHLLSRLSASITLGGRLDLLDRAQLRFIRQHLQAHREIRHLLQQDLYVLSPPLQTAGDRDILQFTDPRSTETVIWIYPPPAIPREPVQRVRPVGLHSQQRYTVITPFSATQRATRSDSSGATLMRRGLPIPATRIPTIYHLRPGRV